MAGIHVRWELHLAPIITTAAAAAALADQLAAALAEVDQTDSITDVVVSSAFDRRAVLVELRAQGDGERDAAHHANGALAAAVLAANAGPLVSPCAAEVLGRTD